MDTFRFSLFIVALLICSQHVFKATLADHAPEKMGFYDEARQEVILVPRSSIPHPSNPAPEPALGGITGQEPLTPIHEETSEDSSGSGSEINEEDETKDGEQIAVSSGLNQTIFNETENTAQRFQTSNKSVAPSSSQQANENLSSNEVPQTPAQSENVITSQSMSFGMPSKPLTPIKPAENVEKVGEDSPAQDENKHPAQITRNRTAKPTSTKIQPNNSNSTETDAGNEAEDNNNVETTDPQTSSKAYDDSTFSKDDMEMQSGSGSNDQEEPGTNDDKTSLFHDTTENTNEADDEEEDDDEDEEDSGSAASGDIAVGEDHSATMLHKNHTLTSTNGPLKTVAHNEKDKQLQSHPASSTEGTFTKDKETENESEEEGATKENNDKDKMRNQAEQQSKTNLSKVEENNQEKHVVDKSEMHTIHTTSKDGNTSLKITEPTPIHESSQVKNISKANAKTTSKHHETVVKASHKKTDHVKHDKPRKINVNHHPANEHGKKQPKPKKPLHKYIEYKTNLRKVHPSKIPPRPQTCNSDEIKTGFSLKGGTRAGHVENLGGTANMPECIKRCCDKKVCDVALLLDGRCFGVACYSKELCEPIPVPHPHYVASQIAFLSQAQRRGEVERAAPEFDCKYGELSIRNNHHWTGELCGGVVSCKNGVVTVTKCSGIPPRPKNCANPKLYVKQKPGHCCSKKWKCQDKSCWYGGRKIQHGVSLSDALCTGVVSCMNGHVKVTNCPGIPPRPTNCANPRLKIITHPGKCCKRKWVCQDKSCSYNNLKVDHGERLTDASCAVVMECNNGFLNFKHCPGPPAIPHGCLNPTLKVQRILGECCNMKWACAPEI